MDKQILIDILEDPEKDDREKVKLLKAILKDKDNYTDEIISYALPSGGFCESEVAVTRFKINYDSLARRIRKKNKCHIWTAKQSLIVGLFALLEEKGLVKNDRFSTDKITYNFLYHFKSEKPKPFKNESLRAYKSSKLNTLKKEVLKILNE